MILVLFTIVLRFQHYPETNNYILKINKNDKNIAENAEVSDGQVSVQSRQ